jgi:mycothiol synthase
VTSGEGNGTAHAAAQNAAGSANAAGSPVGGPPGGGLSISVVRKLTDSDTAAVRRLVEAATETDGVVPLSEHVRLHLKYGGDTDAWHFIARRLSPQGNQLVGYAHLDKTDLVEGPSAELVVAPSARRQGVGGALLDALKLKLSRRRGDGPLRLWAHGALPAADRLAKSRGLETFRELWVLERPLTGPGAELPPTPPVPDIRLAAFRPGVDDEAWLAVNARAFAHHPEQGSTTLDDLRQRMAEPWFDPAGFFLAWRGAHLAGFHWTKVHGSDAAGGPDATHHHQPIGEVYVVGVDPDEQGAGLGKALTLAGLHYLRDRGLDEVILYVDADNPAAVEVYTKLGFTRRSVDVMYRAVA